MAGCVPYKAQALLSAMDAGQRVHPPDDAAAASARVPLSSAAAIAGSVTPGAARASAAARASQSSSPAAAASSCASSTSCACGMRGLSMKSCNPTSRPSCLKREAQNGEGSALQHWNPSYTLTSRAPRTASASAACSSATNTSPAQLASAAGTKGSPPDPCPPSPLRPSACSSAHQACMGGVGVGLQGSMSAPMLLVDVEGV